LSLYQLTLVTELDDLDVPLEDRWTEFIMDKKQSIVNFMKQMDERFKFPEWVVLVAEIYSRIFRH